eukprot:COSAG01_NODE_360_length_18184_cov_21.881780_7_plen_144_part_00
MSLCNVCACHFESEESPAPDALFSCALSLVSFLVALLLSGAESRTFLNPILRRVVADYALAISVALTIGLSFAVSERDANVQRIPTWNITRPTAVRAAPPRAPARAVALSVPMHGPLTPDVCPTDGCPIFASLTGRCVRCACA